MRQTQLPSNELPSLVQIYDQANCAKDLYYLKAIKNTSLSRIVSLAKHFSLLQRAGQQQFANFNQFHKCPSVPVKIYPCLKTFPMVSHFRLNLCAWKFVRTTQRIVQEKCRWFSLNPMCCYSHFHSLVLHIFFCAVCVNYFWDKLLSVIWTSVKHRHKNTPCCSRSKTFFFFYLINNNSGCLKSVFL